MTNPHFQEKKTPRQVITSQSPTPKILQAGDMGFIIGPSPEPVNSVGCNFLRFWAVRAERGR